MPTDELILLLIADCSICENSFGIQILGNRLWLREVRDFCDLVVVNFPIFTKHCNDLHDICSALLPQISSKFKLNVCNVIRQ